MFLSRWHGDGAIKGDKRLSIVNYTALKGAYQIGGFFGRKIVHVDYPSRIMSNLRFLADPGAGFEVVIHGVLKGRLKVSFGGGMEANTIADTCDTAHEDQVVGIIFDMGAVTPVFVQHQRHLPSQSLQGSVFAM